jgi:hypothetical protein
LLISCFNEGGRVQAENIHEAERFARYFLTEHDFHFFGMLPYHPFPQLISIIKMGKKQLEGFCLSAATFPDNLCDTHLKSFVPMRD